MTQNNDPGYYASASASQSQTLAFRPSRVLRKLRAGEVVNTFKLNLEGPRAAHIAALAGFDCLWADREHTSGDWSALESLIYAAKSADADVVVRVRRGSYSDYIHPLELDATGIMVPHIMSLADAQAVVRNTRFHPLGLRPLDGGNADGLYTHLPLDEYLRMGNEERFIVLQIEDVEALDDLDAIAALPGYDVLFFGPGDFSQSIGSPGDFSHPKIVDTRKRIAEACREHGKFAGTVGSLANLDELTDLGYRFINLGADVIGLTQYCRGIMDGFAKRK